MSKEWQDAIGVANEVAEVYERDPDKIIGIIKKAMDKARQDEQRRIIRIIEKEKNSIEKNYLLGEKWDEGAKYVVWVLTCLLKEIEGGERGSLENPQVSARSSDELALKSAGGASLHENGSGRTAPAKIEVKGMSRDG